MRYCPRKSGQSLRKKEQPKPETKKPVSRRSPEPVPDRKGTVKFTRSNGGRRNNRKALMAELSEMDEE